MDTSLLFSRLVSGSVLRALSLFLSAIVAFLMLPFLVENLGTRNYGLWVLVGTILGYHSIMDFGLSTSVSRFFSNALGKQDFEEINRIISSVLILLFILGITIFCIILTTSSFTDLFLEDAVEAQTMKYMIIIIGIAIATQFPLRTFGGVLTSTARHDLIVLTELFRLITRSMLVVYFIWKGHGILTLAFITLFTEMFANLIEYKFAMSQAPYIKFDKKKIEWDTIKKMFEFGWISFIINITDMFRNRLIPLLVAALNGVEMVVFYSVAIRLLEYFVQLMKTTLGITMPIFSQFEGQGKLEQVKKGYEIMLNLTTIAAVFIGANIMFFGKAIITLWMGPTFHLSYIILFILTIPHILSLIQIASEDLLYSIFKHKYIAIVNIISITISVVASFIFDKYFSETGIALGFAIGVGLSSLVMPFIVSRNINSLNVWNLYFKVMILSTIKILVPLGIYFYIIHPYVESNFTSLIIFCIMEITFMGPILYVILPQKVKGIVNQKVKFLFNQFSFIVAR